MGGRIRRSRRLFSPGGGQTTTYRARPVVEPLEWPEYLPPFLDRALRFAPDGMLWVERTVPADAAPVHDVIDAEGRVSYRVSLPKKTRLVGFGANSAYLVRIDDDDLEYLQRYRLPTR
jgi:hypothetical protein